MLTQTHPPISLHHTMNEERPLLIWSTRDWLVWDESERWDRERGRKDMLDRGLEREIGSDSLLPYNWPICESVMVVYLFLRKLHNSFQPDACWSGERHRCRCIHFNSHDEFMNQRRSVLLTLRVWQPGAERWVYLSNRENSECHPETHPQCIPNVPQPCSSRLWERRHIHTHTHQQSIPLTLSVYGS